MAVCLQRSLCLWFIGFLSQKDISSVVGTLISKSFVLLLFSELDAGSFLALLSSIHDFDKTKKSNAFPLLERLFLWFFLNNALSALNAKTRELP